MLSPTINRADERGERSLLDSSEPRPATRLRRLVAFALDVASGVVAAVVGLVLALAWLLVRTSWGLYDPSDIEATIAVSLTAATAPAWYAWLLLSLHDHRATPGQRRAGVAVTSDGPGRGGPSRRSVRYVRFALHPLAAPGWAWLAVLLWLAAVPWLWIAPLALAGAVLVAGGLSAILLLLPGGAPPLHDRLAGARVIARD